MANGPTARPGETLTPVGAASTDDVSPPEGEYRVEGRNADGKDYEGTVIIAKSGKRFSSEMEGRRIGV